MISTIHEQMFGKLVTIGIINRSGNLQTGEYPKLENQWLTNLIDQGFHVPPAPAATGPDAHEPGTTTTTPAGSGPQ
ncbi:MAG: hypothetical protein WC295_01510 [Methanoregula sp.]|jgi:hypothetical protein